MSVSWNVYIYICNTYKHSNTFKNLYNKYGLMWPPKVKLMPGKNIHNIEIRNFYSQNNLSVITYINFLLPLDR